MLRLALAACAMAIRLFAAAPVALEGGAGFTENKGQFPPHVRFAMESGGPYLTSTSLVLTPDQAAIQFAGGNPAAVVSPLDPQGYVVNTYTGADPTRWITGARVFGRIQYTDLWPGVDAVFSQEATFRFVVKPGGNASAIAFSYNGVNAQPSPFSDSQILLNFSWGRVGQNAVAYQENNGTRTPVQVRYTAAAGTFGIALGEYDRARPVLIDNSIPLGGAGRPEPTAVSRSGAMYGAGAAGTLVTSVPSTVPAANVCDTLGRVTPCHDVIIAGYSAAGELRYLTRLQGTLADGAAAIAVDANDVVYVAGQTNSSDFPTTAGAPQTRYAGPTPTARIPFFEPVRGDLFFAKLDGATGRLLYSTYLGGPAEDTSTTLHIDRAGNAYIGGPASPNLPVTAGALSAKPCEWRPLPALAPVPCVLGYVAKVDPLGRVAYLTYLPGGPQTFAVDTAGSVYFAGSAAPDELTTTPGAYRRAPDASRGAFVAKLNPTGAALVYATYLGSPDDSVESLAVDSAGNTWLLSPHTDKVTTTWIDRRYDPRLVKLNAAGAAVLYETPFLGGTLAVDPHDRLAVLTKNYVNQIVRTPKGLVNSVCGDMTLSLLAADGTVLLNRAGDFGYAAALADDGRLIHAGYPQGVGRFGAEAPEPADGPRAACLVNGASLSARNRLAPGQIFTLLGVGVGPKTPATFQLDSRGMVPNSLGSLRVLVGGAPVPVLYAHDGQINAIAPFNLPDTTFTIEVEYEGRRSPAFTVASAETQPGLFTRDGSGAGYALAFNEDGTLNTPSNPAKLGSILTLFATGTGATVPASVEGAVAQSTEAHPFWPASLILGGVPGGILTEVLYAGPSPGALTSITQINLRLPASVPSNAGQRLDAWPIVFTGPVTQLAAIALKN